MDPLAATVPHVAEALMLPESTVRAKRIQRRRTKGWRMPPGAVYVGRPSRWGNPWRVGDWWLGEPMTRLDAVRRFSLDLSEQAARGALDLGPLRGHDLACFCPLVDEHGNIVPCHADVLLELANRDEGDRLRLDDRETV
jgi:hypothetical protein